LGHAVGDALAVDDLFQPEVIIDRFGAERGTAGAIVFLMVGIDSARGLREAARGATGGAA
jgi:hypothetical protein